MWILLFNPTSGGGKGGKIAYRALELLREKGIQVQDIFGESYLDATQSFQDALRQHRDQIDGVIVVGGDGMVHLAVQELGGTSIPLALIPAGTGNDFARVLNLNLEDPLSNLELVFSQRPVQVDLGIVNERYFADILSTGFDSVVNERANRLTLIKGRLKYNLAILLVLSTFKPKRYSFRVDGVEFSTEAMLIAVSNGHSYGGGMKIAPDALVDDGLFDVMILGPVSKFEFLKVFPKVFTGSHVTHPAVKILKGRTVAIDSDAVAYADGERISELPVVARIAPLSLWIWRNV